MSSEPERVFLGAKHTISEQRWSLEIETIELLECLKLWFRIGVFTEEDLQWRLYRPAPVHVSTSYFNENLRSFWINSDSFPSSVCTCLYL